MSEPLRYRSQLLICAGKACKERHDPEAAKHYFKSRIKDEGLKAEVRAVTCSCLDYCDDGPNFVIYRKDKAGGDLHKDVSEADWPRLFEQLTKP